MSYNVGQVVFLLLKKEMRVIPARVVEQTVTRTLEGEDISFSVCIPGVDRKDKKYKLKRLNAEVFTSLLDVKSMMLTNATKTIDSILLIAEDLAFNSFDYKTSDVEQHEYNEADEKQEGLDSLNSVIDNIIQGEGVTEIDLGNGMKAKINPKNIPL